MATSVNHSLDFKLLFDSLAEHNGCIRLEKLLKYWPEINKEQESPLPLYIKHWQTSASANNGLLTWSAFSSGLQEGFKRTDVTPLTTQTITTQELEKALEENSSKESIVDALKISRKEVYKSQKSSNNFASSSPRKDLQRSHQRSYSSGHSLPKDIPPEQREKIVLQQLEELLRDKTQEKGGISSSSQAMINEVLQQLKSILRMSSRVSGSHDQLNTLPANNPYATIRRRHSRSSSSSHYASPHLIDGIKIDRSLSMPYHHLPMDSEPPPPYSPTSPTSPTFTTNYPLYSHPSHPHSTLPHSSKRHAMSMTNIDIASSGITPPHTGQPTNFPPNMSHSQRANSTRQLLENWKQAQITSGGSAEGRSPHYRQMKEASKHYRSSPELSQEQMTREEVNTAQTYGTLVRRPSKKSSKGQEQQQQQQSHINAQSIQIRRLENEKDALIKTIFRQRAAQNYNPNNDSIMDVP